MSNKLLRLVIALCFALGAAAASGAPASFSGQGLSGALFMSFSGSCGGWVRDVEQDLYCCTLDQRPTCDDGGDCQCSFDDYCYKICTAEGTCDQDGGDCPEEDDRSTASSPLSLEGGR